MAVHPSVVSNTVLAFAQVLEELQSVFETYRSPFAVLQGGRGSNTIPRQRRSVESIFAEYGPIYSRRAYRMNVDAFYYLLDIIKPYMPGRSDGSSRGGATWNGEIGMDLKLSVALRFFAGGEDLVQRVGHR